MTTLVQQSGGVNVDASGSAPAVGTVLKTIAANPKRKAAFVQNQSAATLQVVLDDGVGSTATIILLAGNGANSQGGYWDTSGFLHMGRIRVCGTASSQFGAAEIT